MADGFDKLRVYAASLSGRLYKGLLRATLHLEAVTVGEAPTVTGNLRNHINSYTIDQGLRSFGIVNIGADYAGYVIRGTGIYGPLKRRITPTTKKALRWVSGGAVYIRRSVKGQKPNPFHKRAWRKARAAINRIFRSAL